LGDWTQVNQTLGSQWVHLLNRYARLNYDKNDSGVTTCKSLATTFNPYAYHGGVLMLDGRVFLVPSNSTIARIYDPTTHTLTTAGGVYPSNLDSFMGGTLLADGRVFCCPYNSRRAVIYDPVSDSITSSSPVFNGNIGFMGSVLLANGQIFLTPSSLENHIGIYDVDTDTLSRPVAVAASDCSAALLPDNRVLCVPHTAGQPILIYDSSTQDLVFGAVRSPGKISDCIVLPSGKVFLVPSSGGVGYLYDYRADTITTTASGFIPMIGGYRGGVLLPDGRVLVIPHSAYSAVIYDPITNTALTLPDDFGGSYSYAGGLLLPNGSVFLCPRGQSTLVTYRVSVWSALFSLMMLTSPYLNRAL
jgi:WD40 repeat protein